MTAMVFGLRRLMARRWIWGWAVCVALLAAGASRRAVVLSGVMSLALLLDTAALRLGLTIAASTLVSEDLACIGAGVLAAQGRISFALAVAACFVGLLVGDVLLFFAGRLFGRAVLARAPLKWFVRAADVERSAAWLERRGAAVIFISRFVPGTRLPTYFAAGALGTGFGRFLFYFSLAAVVWTPLLVGLSAWVGGETVTAALRAREHALLGVAAAGTAVYCAIKLTLRLTTWRGRRLLVGTWRRLTRWEFWPPSAFYPPVVAYLLWLMLKHRSITLFTAANPAIIGGGFVGESKIDILRGLAGAGEFVAHAELIEAASDLQSRIAAVHRFMAEHGLDFPVVLKPNQGQRGAGVAVVRSERELEGYLRSTDVDTIIQEYAPGLEFGVFYYRLPGEEKGHVFSITEKKFPVISGDGVHTLEQLILNDERAVCMARFYLTKHGDRLWDVPHAGERVQLVELGTHCRGAVFLDGEWARTPALEAAFDEISRSYDGFCFGRYDVRTLAVEDFKAGRNFKIVELNGVTSEATNIYDSRNSLFTAYRVLFAQWRLAFEIGARNVSRGAQAASLRTLIKLVIDDRRAAIIRLAAG